MLHPITVSSLIALLFLLGINCSKNVQNDEATFSPYYQRRMNNNVISPFLKAYSILKKKVIDKVLELEQYADVKQLKKLADSLRCQFQTITKELRRASDASTQISRSLENESMKLNLKVVKQKKIVEEKEQDVKVAKTNFEAAQNEAKFKEEALENQKRLVEAAERDVKEAEAAVQRSYNCERKRRRKRFLGDLCYALSDKGVENAQQRLTSAVQARHSLQYGFQNLQTSVKTYRFRLQTSESRLNVANKELTNTQIKLNQAQISFKYAATINKKIKGIEGYVSNVFDSSHSLKEQLKGLLNVQNLINPLNEMYQQMVNQTFTKINNNDQSDIISSDISQRLQNIEEIAENWSLLMTEDDLDKEESNDEFSMPCLSFDFD